MKSTVKKQYKGQTTTKKSQKELPSKYDKRNKEYQNTKSIKKTQLYQCPFTILFYYFRAMAK